MSNDARHPLVSHLVFLFDAFLVLVFPELLVAPFASVFVPLRVLIAFGRACRG